MNHIKIIKRKLIVSDLDGTLLNNDSELTYDTIKYIKNLIMDPNIIFCIATGRKLEGCINYYKQLGLNSLLVCHNGAHIVSPNDLKFDNIYFSMSKEIFYKIWNDKMIRNICEYFIINTKEGVYIDKIPQNNEIKNKLKTLLHIDFTKIDNIENDLLIKYQNRTSDLTNICLIIKKDNSFNCVMKRIKDITNVIDIVPWSVNLKENNEDFIILELINMFSNKLLATRYLQNYYDISNSDTYFFGDGVNDSKVLAKFENAYCMSNAHSSIIMLSKKITAYSNQENGVIKMIDFILKN